MSLIRQLWLAIVLVTLIAFGGSAAIGILSAKGYLEEQLRVKNLDGATVLATLLSQSPKDEVTVEILLSAQFDTGHYDRIVLLDPSGGVIVERRSSVPGPSAPAWFARLISIAAEPGIAQVHAGWRKFGTLEISSHPGFAYAALWDGMVRLLGWFMLAAVLAGGVGSVLLRLILRPLGAVIRQAEAIGDRRFVANDEPSTREFRTLVRAMNRLTTNVRRMLDEESARLEELRRAAHHDTVSGLLNREHFLARTQVVLSRDDAGAEGVLVLWRLLGLQALNRSNGWAVTDVLVGRLGQALAGMSSPEAEWIGGRLNGSDFVLLAPGAQDAELLARRLRDVAELIVRELDLPPLRIPAAAVHYGGGDRVSDLLTRIDKALLAAVSDEDAAALVSVAPGQRPEREHLADAERWRALLDGVLRSGELDLQAFPVVDARGELLHRECVARLRSSENRKYFTYSECT